MNEPPPTASVPPDADTPQSDPSQLPSQEPAAADPWWFSADPDHSPIHHPWLERFVWLMAGTTFLLIILGGTVTSKDAGLAVPDWPHTFGYNMLTFPPSKWVGGVFWEHTHRLLATLVGTLALIFMSWVLFAHRISMTIRTLGAVILVLVIIQGVMGGLRVTEISTALGVVHGITGQLFFALVLVTAVMTGKRWLKRPVASQASKTQAQRSTKAASSDKGISSMTLACIFLGVLVIQLALGATMRHYRAGLAIPDFPTAYGQLVPPLTTKGIEHAMDTHAGGGDQKLEGYYSPFKVSVHFAHRLWAITVVVMAIVLITAMAKRKQLDDPMLLKLSLAIVALLVLQVALGAMVIWTGRYPDVATAHQATGAAILGLSTLLMMNLKMLPEHLCSTNVLLTDQQSASNASQATSQTATIESHSGSSASAVSTTETMS